MAKLLDGKTCAAHITSRIEQRVLQIKGRKPTLAFILVGQNSASQSYVRMKKKACAETGIRSILIELSASIAEADLIAQVSMLNQDVSVDGILIQLPLPAHIDEKMVMQTIDPIKDVDGFHPINIGKMLLGDPTARLPCTPLGIQTLLDYYNISVSGKHVVIIGRSNIVGKPLAAILMQKRASCNATVTVCHSKSEKLEQLTQSADILIAAIGRPHFITREHVLNGVIVIDVGINRVDGRIIGDVDFDAVSEKAAWISPVPGGGWSDDHCIFAPKYAILF